MDALKNLFLAAIGGTTLSYEKAEEILKQLVDKGKLSVTEGQALGQDLKRRVKGENRAHDATLETAIAENTQLMQRNLEALTARVDVLAAEIEALKASADQ